MDTSGDFWVSIYSSVREACSFMGDVGGKNVKAIVRTVKHKPLTEGTEIFIYH